MSQFREKGANGYSQSEMPEEQKDNYSGSESETEDQQQTSMSSSNYPNQQDSSSDSSEGENAAQAAAPRPKSIPQRKAPPKQSPSAAQRKQKPQASNSSATMYPNARQNPQAQPQQKAPIPKHHNPQQALSQAPIPKKQTPVPQATQAAAPATQVAAPQNGTTASAPAPQSSNSEGGRNGSKYDGWDYDEKQVFTRTVRIPIKAAGGEEGIAAAKREGNMDNDPSMFVLTEEMVKKLMSPDSSDDFESQWTGKSCDFDPNLVKIVGIDFCNQSGATPRPLGLRMPQYPWFNKIGVPTNDETSLLAEMGECCSPCTLYDCKSQVLESRLYGAMGHCSPERLKEECLRNPPSSLKFPLHFGQTVGCVGVIQGGSLSRILGSLTHRDEYGLDRNWKAPIYDGYCYYPADQVVQCIYQTSQRLVHLRNINLVGTQFEWLPADGSDWADMTGVFQSEGKESGSPFNASITLKFHMIQPRSKIHTLKKKKKCVSDQFDAAWTSLFKYIPH